MDPRRVVVSVLAGIVMIGVVVAYSVYTVPPQVDPGSLSAPASMQADTTSTGSQPVLCTATSYFVPSTVTVALSTITLTYGNATTVQTFIPRDPITTETTTSVFTSATNSTDPVGYVVTSTSVDPGSEPPAAQSVMTCTYLP